MNKLHQKRILYLFLVVAFFILVLMLILNALRYNINLYVTPSELIDKPHQQIVRLGGLVVDQSVVYDESNHSVFFQITDGKKTRHVQFQGLLPALFKEGKGVIAEGRLSKNGSFIASNILAKHDESYRPPAVKQ